MTLTSDDALWRAKLHARLHDPAKRALAQFRDLAGHEGGATRPLHTVLFEEISDDVRRQVERADRWVSAADRPQLPESAPWAHLRWTDDPILIHPLTGKKFNLHSPVHKGAADAKGRSLTHFEELIVGTDDDAGDRSGEAAAVDWQRTLLAYWRFGPQLDATNAEDNGKLGALWPHLPADTRIPDHAIWDHLDLTSAFAGAFTADPKCEAALLALSIGPVQPFIAAARSTSDMWAGSHLLARLSWEAMRVVCERLGPDAILFPRLRGIPQVDLWLREDCNLRPHWFHRCEWTRSATDANPLFTAALPNRFVAVAPAGAAAELAGEVAGRVRDWLRRLGETVVDRLLEAARFRAECDARDESVHAYQQMRKQLDGFPEVHWAAVPFSLIRPRNVERGTDLDTARLSRVMAPFFGSAPDEPCGFLASPAWKRLQRELRGFDDTSFYAPNPGVLYPAVYDLAERVLAAAKAVRPFAQIEQHGWRCSLTGETEWLTTDPAQLETSYRRQGDTLWARIARHKPAWAKPGEHLGALAAVKRLWPTLFAEEAGAAVREREPAAADRFVVSTHTMALAAQIEHWLDNGGQIPNDLRDAITQHKPSSVALPRRLSRRYGTKPTFDVARCLPELLGTVREGDDEPERRRVEKAIRNALGQSRIETYYALLLMDGDRMGRILSGDDPHHSITCAESFHPTVRLGFKKEAKDHSDIIAYVNAKRAMSPNRHLAISAALNEFALHVVPAVIEDEHLGRVLYAGGDDVLAMLPASDLLPAMRRLRHAYSGADPQDASRQWCDAKDSRSRLLCRDGFAMLRGRLMRMMGHRATASCGAVIAHYQAPLAAVMRELRAAEGRAKDAGRNRFSLTVIKRSGGALNLTDGWDEPLSLLLDTRDFLGEPGVSRRAVYHSLVWLRDLPDDADTDMLGPLLAFQFDRQISDRKVRDSHDVPGIAQRLARLAVERGSGRDRIDWLGGFLSVAEFLAREARWPQGGGQPATTREAA